MEILSHDDLNRIADLVETYTDLPLGGTDASAVAVAERHHETTLATLDHRHFSVVRPAHTDGSSFFHEPRASSMNKVSGACRRPANLALPTTTLREDSVAGLFPTYRAVSSCANVLAGFSRG